MKDTGNNGDKPASVLTINVGSSSIRFAFFTGGTLERGLSGHVERIGLPGTVLKFQRRGGRNPSPKLSRRTRRRG